MSSQSQQAPSTASIHPDTRIGAAHLTVSDVDRSTAFYERTLGLQVHRREGDAAYLGVGGEDLLALEESPGARQVAGTTGLYHFALRVPTRRELARTLRHFLETGTVELGFGDHWVSESLYLSDPDGLGVEVYWDRPRDGWPIEVWQSKRTTAQLVPQDVLAELDGHDEAWAGLHAGADMGHVHLHVADIPAAEHFYGEVLGFDLIRRRGDTATFLSAGGYHHHVAVNTWAGVGAPPAPDDAAGLRWFEVILPDQADVDRIAERIRAEDLTLQEADGGLLVADPSGNGVVLTRAA